MINWTITLGNILSVLGFTISIAWAVIKIQHTLEKEVIRLRDTLNTHSNMLDGHSLRLEKHDELILKLVGDIERLIGRLGRT